MYSNHKNILKQKKLRSTSTRLNLLKVIDDFGSAMPNSAIQIAMANTDRITLYRTINMFIEKGIIHKAFSNSKDTYYALCGSECSSMNHKDNHAHFTCLECSNVTCEKINSEIKISIPQFKIDKSIIHLFGTCKNCIALKRP